MIVQLRLRRGTTIEWEAANPILAEGEPGWDTTENTFKVGDGSSAWNDLAYQSFDVALLTDRLTATEAARDAALQAETNAETAETNAEAALAAMAKGEPGGVAELNVNGDALDAAGNVLATVDHTHDTTHVHTENVTRIVYDGGYAARPAEATYVEWIGPVEPVAMVAGDTWVEVA